LLTNSGKAGVEFIDENGGGAGVRLRKLRKVRAKLMATFDLTSGDYQKLRRLAALDHYGRVAC
jgi:hypothetical protein